MDRLAQKHELALNAIIIVAVRNLERFDFENDAAQIRREWKGYRGKLQTIVAHLSYGDDRDLADLQGMMAWVDKTYYWIESKLGYQLCRALRITDLITLNRFDWVFRPCTIGETLWSEVLCHDGPTCPKPMRGNLPTISYWATQITCGILTFGAGIISFACGPLAMASEFAMDKWACPWLEPKLYSWACDKGGDYVSSEIQYLSQQRY